ncbi:MAG TPA: alpha/beta hydrolase [Gemmataceae bacterium]|nr:alpha/beta hydrolase [Gemmataceae bacterium]
MKHSLEGLAIYWCCAAVAGILGMPPCVWAQEEKTSKKTFTYKTVEKCDIKADVYGASTEGTRPVVIWIHGGALIMGHRGQIDQALLGKLLKAGYTVVSIDYRLAPETKLPAILEDLGDAYKWVREKGPGLFHIDPNRIAVMGGSAGGYLTLAAGFRVDPRPTALVSFWGYGDIAGAWYSQPDPFYSRMPFVPKEEAYQAVGGAVISESSGKNNRHRFYLYCRQQGLWPKEVTGHDPDKEDKAFEPFCPLRNVSVKYPPTLLIHGTNDSDVPYEQSALMAKELTRKGVEHELRTIQDAGHGLAGAKPAVVAEVHDRVLGFLNKHLR